MARPFTPDGSAYPPGGSPHPEPGRILLYALLPIGDTLFTIPTIRALRDRYPAAHITALVHATSAPILRCVPAVDEVVVLPVAADWVGALPLVHVLWRLRARRYDVAIDFTTPAYKWISFACGIPQRTYMKFEPLWWIVPGRHRRWRSTHATRHYYDCARELDLPPWDRADHVPRLDLPPSEHTAAARFLREHDVTAGPGRAAEGPLVGLHAGGAWLGGLKRWPPERFAMLADRLHERWNARVLLLGGRHEHDLARAIVSAMASTPIVAVGAAPLLTSMALVAACDLFIGNDSGILHAAAAMGTPYVGIFGPTWPPNFEPIGVRPCQGTLVRPPWPCRTPHYFVGGNPIWRRPDCADTCQALMAVSADAVFAAADALLRQWLVASEG